MVLIIKMKNILKKNRLNIFISLILILFFLSVFYSCRSDINGDTKEIKLLIEEIIDDKKKEFIIVKSDSLIILNSGLPPYIYKKFTIEKIYTEPDDGIVVIEIDDDTTVRHINKFHSLIGDIKTQKFYFKKYDTIFFNTIKMNHKKYIQIW